MKRLLIYCFSILFLMSSCLEEPDIYRLLPVEDAAVIPYKVGDEVSMLNQDGDTIRFIVTYDEREIYDSYDGWPFADDTKFDYEPGPWCYCRRVQLRSYASNIRLAFIALPYKAFDFRWEDLWGFRCHLNGETTTFTINDVSYDHVYFRQELNEETGDPIYQWYFNETDGLLCVKYSENSLTILPKSTN